MKRQYHLRLLILSVAILIGSSAASASAPSDRNCDDFDDHASAQAYFDEAGGSRTTNVDLLDGDHDGNACERLIRVGRFTRAVETVSDGGIGTAAALGLVVAVAVGGIWLVRKRWSSARKAVEPTTDLTVPLTASVNVPSLREPESRGYLVLTVNTIDGAAVPRSSQLQIDSAAGTPGVTAEQRSATADELTLDLPVGEYLVQVVQADPYADLNQVAFVAKDDVSRVLLTLRDPEPAAKVQGVADSAPE